jgi:hypothetical protein
VDERGDLVAKLRLVEQQLNAERRTLESFKDYFGHK